jgi:hypothetical protein
MTFFQHLQSHKGGLIRLKTQLFWYGGRGYDNNPGRICLLLDADAAARRTAATRTAAASTAAAKTTAAKTTAAVAVQIRAAALLLVDGAPHWVWVVEADTELL